MFDRFVECLLAEVAEWVNDCPMSNAAPAIAVPDVAPELNPQLDARALAEEFRSKQRIHIQNILTEPAAMRLFQVLQKETPWTVTFNKGMDFFDVENVSLEERALMSRNAFERARAGFAYIFDNHRLSRNGEPYRDPNHYLAQFVAFMNSAPVLEFMRGVTGLAEIAWTDAQATLYRPGDFLTLHDDKTGGHKRLAAYVLNMTPGWQPDWGGALQFFDERGHISEAYLPRFNALNIFRVPVPHAVSQVAFFGGYRYSITGWFHAR